MSLSKKIWPQTEESTSQALDTRPPALLAKVYTYSALNAFEFVNEGFAEHTLQFYEPMLNVFPCVSSYRRWDKGTRRYAVHFTPPGKEFLFLMRTLDDYEMFMRQWLPVASTLENEHLPAMITRAIDPNNPEYTQF